MSAAIETRKREEETRTRDDKAGGAMTEMCSVRLGKGWFGIPITYILEIVGGARPQPIPLAPDYVGGLVHYRGDVLTTVSLRRLLNLEPAEGHQDILVLEGDSGPFGVLVDGVGEVLTLPAADFEPNPSILNESRRALFAGSYKCKDGLIVMLNPERLDPMQLARAA